MRAFGVCTSLLILALVSTVSADWEHIGPEGGSVGFIHQSFTDCDLLYAFAGSGESYVIVKSTDGGDNWNPTGGGIDERLNTTAIGPDGTLYAGTTDTILSSGDEGLTWTVHTLTGFTPIAITAHPTNPDFVYAAGTEVVGTTYWITMAVTVNGGSTWNLDRITSSYEGFGRSIDVSESSPNTIYLGGQSRSPNEPKLFRSINGGGSWSEIAYTGWNGGGSMYSVAIHPTTPTTVLAATSNGIYRTTDGGTSWTQTSSSTFYHWGMQYSLDNPSVVVAGGKTYFLRSLNGGVNWTTHTTGLPGGAVQSVVPDWSNSSRVLTASFAGIYRSDNTGTSWYATNGGLYLGSVLCLHRTDSTPYALYASLVDLGLFRTTDNGNTWESIETPLDCGNLCTVVTQSGNPNRVLVLEGTG